MAALVFKLGALMMKTLSKPLADRFKTWVMSHPQYRRNVLKVAEVRTPLQGVVGIPVGGARAAAAGVRLRWCRQPLQPPMPGAFLYALHDGKTTPASGWHSSSSSSRAPDTHATTQTPCSMRTASRSA